MLKLKLKAQSHEAAISRLQAAGVLKLYTCDVSDTLKRSRLQAAGVLKLGSRYIG